MLTGIRLDMTIKQSSYRSKNHSSEELGVNHYSEGLICLENCEENGKIFGLPYLFPVLDNGVKRTKESEKKRIIVPKIKNKTLENIFEKALRYRVALEVYYNAFLSASNIFNKRESKSQMDKICQILSSLESNTSKELIREA